jgi:hypothetical protein
MRQATFSGTARDGSEAGSGAVLAVAASSGGISAVGIVSSAPVGGARPANFSRDPAIEARGAEKLGNWTRASRRAAIQKM